MFKKIIRIIIFAFCVLNVNMAFSANFYWVGADNDWGTATNWATESGGSTKHPNPPTSSDDVFFDSASSGYSDCHMHSSAVSKSIDCTGFTKNLELEAGLTVSGSITLVSGMGWSAGTQTVTINESGTLTSGGKSFYGLTLGGADSKTLTLGDNCTVTGTFTNSYIWTINSNNLNLQGHITGTSNKYIDGTASVNITGGANQTWTGNGGGIRNNFTINKSGNTLTLSGTCMKSTNTLTYTAGTVDCGTSTMQFGSAASQTTTVNANGINFNNVSFGSGNGTVTLSSNLSVDGTLTVSQTTTCNGNQINASGSFTLNGILSGTTDILLDGTGTWSGSQNLNNDITINTAGTITLGTTLNYRTGTCSYVAGTVVTTGNTFRVATNSTLDVDGITFNNMSFSGTTTLTGDILMSGVLSNFTANAILNGQKITCSGNFTITNGLQMSGTTDIFLTGGTWSAGALSSSNVQNDLTFDGNVTISGTVYYDTGTLLWQSGTITTTGSTLSIGGNTTINTSASGMSFNNFTMTAGIITLANTLDVNGNLTMGTGTFNQAGYQVNCAGNWTKAGTYTHGNGKVVFDGSGTSIINGASTFYDLTCIIPSKALSFESGVTQTIAHTLTLNGQASGTKVVLNRNGGSGTDRFTFDCTSPQAVTFVDVTNSNASTSNITATKSKNSGNTDSAEAAPHWIISGDGSQII